MSPAPGPVSEATFQGASLARLHVRDVLVPCTGAADPSRHERPPVGAARGACAACALEIWVPAGASHAAERVAARLVAVCFDCLQPLASRLTPAA